MPLKKTHQSQGTAKVKNICPVAVTTAVQMTVLGKMSCRQLFTSIFFVTRCHCTHKCVPGTPGNLGTEGLRTWEEVASYSSTAVWLSLLPSGLAPISVFTSFWSRSRFIHLCSKRFTVDLRTNFFFFFLLTLKIPLMTRFSIFQLQLDKQRSWHLSCCRKGVPAHTLDGPTRLSLKDTFP